MLVRLAKSGGICPDRLLSLSSSLVTRPFMSVATPYHSSKGSSLNQFVFFVQFSPSVAL